MKMQNWTKVETNVSPNGHIEVDRATLPADEKFVVADLAYGYYQVGNMLLGEVFLTPNGDSIEPSYIRRWFYI